MSDKSMEYTNGELTVVWKPDVCIHSGICVQSLPQVFNPKARPWVDMGVKTTEEIKAAIDKCPSEALSYRMNDGSEAQPTIDNQDTHSVRIEVKSNGPLLVHGSCTITHKDGSTELKEMRTSFCRCGASENKPFCDGAHRKIEFKDE